jgi:hypothetical protein
VVFNEQFNSKQLEKSIGGIIQSAFIDKNGLHWGNHAQLKVNKDGALTIVERTVRIWDGSVFCKVEK